jgi:hypothetical protein
MKKIFETLSDQRGFAIFGAILILALVTVIGVAAIATSTSERRTATNYLLYERVFYTAEAGLEHAKEAFKNTLRTPNQLAVMATTGRPNWSFALVGATVANPVVTVPGFANLPIDGSTYTITVWDNNDDADPAIDSDGLLFIRSDATGPRNQTCSIETLVTAIATSSPIAGYNAQEGGGSGKNYTSNDRDSVDFNPLTGFGGRRMNVGG